MHPLLSTSMAKSPKPRLLETCPATTSNKSNASMLTPLVDVGTPATFYTEDLQVVQSSLKKAREELHKDKRVSHTTGSEVEISY